MKIAPCLRFPEFNDPWTKKQLGEFMEFKNGINADKAQYGSGRKFINVLDIIADRPIMHDQIIGRVDVSDKEFDKNKVVFGDILLCFQPRRALLRKVMRGLIKYFKWYL